MSIIPQPSITYLSEMWPFFLMGQDERLTPEQALTPETPDAIRAVFGPIFERTNPTAARGLERADDAELVYWGRIFRAPLLSGEDDLTFLPPWLASEGQVMPGVARVLTLALYERHDVFLAAMHARGLE